MPSKWRKKEGIQDALLHEHVTQEVADRVVLLEDAERRLTSIGVGSDLRCGKQEGEEEEVSFDGGGREVEVAREGEGGA